ncbi:hypothetical protein K8Q98_02660 [Candidatus Nomurabacteria bacterium]|nr:hypothetical protein [Candidatus Nomurabacteria bacterium]
MNRKKLLKNIFFLMLLMFLANSLIIKFHLYYSVWWVDMVMHFGGGFWVGLFFFYVFYTREWFSSKLLSVFISILLIGLLWELFEYYLNIISYEPFVLSDTLSDIFFDMAGGLLSMIYFSKRIMFTSKNKI